MTIYDSTIGFFAEKTSMHGVRYAYEAANRPSRCLWASITLCLTALASVYGWEVCHVYLVEQEPITRISYMTPGRKGLSLPVATVCPSRNPFLLHRLHERNISHNAAAFLLLMVDQPSHVGHLLSSSAELKQQLNNELRTSLRPGETLYDLFNYLSPECEDMVASCFVFGERLNGSECCRQVFSGDYYIYYQSRCITTLLSSRLSAENQTEPGDYSGLGIILKDDTETFYAERDLRYSLVPAQEGNRLILTPHYIQPREAVTQQSFIAAVGSVTRLSVLESVVDRSGEFISQLPFSEKTCTDIPPIGTQIPKVSCRGENHQKAFQKSCGCEHATALQSPQYQGKMTVCEPLDIISCQKAADENLLHLPSQRCAMQCQKVIHQVITDGSSIKRPMLDNDEFFLGSPTSADSDRNLTFSVVMLFYPTLVSKMIQLSKPTLMEWLSAFGGQLSLFVGASVITMLEMVFFSVRVMTIVGNRVFETLLGRTRVGGWRSE